MDNKIVLRNYEDFVFWSGKVSYQLIKCLQEMLAKYAEILNAFFVNLVE